MNKLCGRCGVSKPEGDFWKLSRGGLQSWCRECNKQYQQEHQLERAACRHRWGVNHRTETAAYQTAHMDQCIAAVRKWQKENPEAVKAQKALMHAVQGGKVQKPDACTICGASIPARLLHGHHMKYEEALNVTFCCPQCHKNLHRNAPDGTRRRNHEFPKQHSVVQDGEPYIRRISAIQGRTTVPGMREGRS